MGDGEAKISVQVSSQLLAELLQPPPSAAPAAQSPSAPAESPTSTSQFDLLLDVELPVSVSFGRALVPLKEVLKLSSGSIVELNRAVTEPVEVIVNNCVIARGEVVVVEGNYGVRIQQIVSRQDRLRTVN
jgi:flagellar motor switch protein FliN/FliY